MWTHDRPTDSRSKDSAGRIGVFVRTLTSLQFCCAGWSLTRGRELSGERPRTLI